MHYVARIELNMAEGKHAHKSFTASTWAAADAKLREWANDAPKKGGYDKCDFTLTFDDGLTYQGQYDVVHTSVEYPSISSHVRAVLEFYGGVAKYNDITDAEWMRILSKRGDEPSKLRSFLTNHEIPELGA